MNQFTNFMDYIVPTKHMSPFWAGFFGIFRHFVWMGPNAYRKNSRHDETSTSRPKDRGNRSGRRPLSGCGTKSTAR